MAKANQAIREYAREHAVFLWELANAMGVSEPTMTRMLRCEVPAEKRTKLLQMIDEIAHAKKSVC